MHVAALNLSAPPVITVAVLRRALIMGARRVIAASDELNRINVFPVPDGDTGTNFSLTLRAVADALRALGDAPLLRNQPARSAR